MTLLVVLLAVAAPRGAAAAAAVADYDKVLEAWKNSRWAAFDALSARFLEEKPKNGYIHAVRYLRADSYSKRRRWKACEAEAAAYLREHPGRKYSSKARWLLGLALEGQRRFGEAVEAYAALKTEEAAYRIGVALFRGREYARAGRALESFLQRFPDSRRSHPAREYLGRIEPGYEAPDSGFVEAYSGKYEKDPRLPAVRARVRRLYTAAVRAIEARVGKLRADWLVRLVDSGSDRSGIWAQVRTEVVSATARNVLTLRTEHLMLDTHDLKKTLVHELYHCLQRSRLGAEEHKGTPKWMREGAALYVAGQADERLRLLVAYVGSDRRLKIPLARLVNGLEGRHGLEDYAEDVCAFLAVEQRHGRAKASALLKRLLETTDTKAAIRDTLGESFGMFDSATGAYALRRAGELLETGRTELLGMQRLLRAGDNEEALKLEARGIYAPLAAYYRAVALFRLGRHREALAAIGTPGLQRTTRVGDAALLRLRILKALNHPGYREAARRALLDLEPIASSSVYGEVKELVAGE